MRSICGVFAFVEFVIPLMMMMLMMLMLVVLCMMINWPLNWLSDPISWYIHLFWSRYSLSQQHQIVSGFTAMKLKTNIVLTLFFFIQFLFFSFEQTKNILKKMIYVKYSERKKTLYSHKLLACEELECAQYGLILLNFGF